MRNHNGITLVNLVVTIIILIILAGISINMLLGENGIIIKAKQAKENTILAQELEIMQLNQLYEQLEKNEQITTDGDKDAEIVSLLNQLEEKEAAINTLINELNAFRRKIAIAITEEGIETSETDTAEKMIENMRSLLERSKQQSGSLTVYRHATLAIATLTIDVSNYNTFQIGDFSGYKTTDNFFNLSITADGTNLNQETDRSLDYLNTNYRGKVYDVSNVENLVIQFSQKENSIRYDAVMTYTLQ